MARAEEAGWGALPGAERRISPAPEQLEAIARPEFREALKVAWKGPGELIPTGETEAEAIQNAILRTVTGVMSAESLATMLGASAIGKALVTAANVPKVARALKEYPTVAKALDIASRAAVPATFGGMATVAGVGEVKAAVEAPPGPERTAHLTGAAVNALFAALGMVGVTRAAGAARAYPPAEGAPKTAGEARAVAAELRRTGQRLPAEQWAAQAQKVATDAWTRVFGEDIPVDLRGRALTIRFIGVSPESNRPAFEVVEEGTGQAVYGGTGGDVLNWLRMMGGRPRAPTPEAPAPPAEVRPVAPGAPPPAAAPTLPPPVAAPPVAAPLPPRPTPVAPKPAAAVAVPPAIPVPPPVGVPAGPPRKIVSVTPIPAEEAAAAPPEAVVRPEEAGVAPTAPVAAGAPEGAAQETYRRVQRKLEQTPGRRLDLEQLIELDPDSPKSDELGVSTDLQDVVGYLRQDGYSEAEIDQVLQARRENVAFEEQRIAKGAEAGTVVYPGGWAYEAVGKALGAARDPKNPAMFHWQGDSLKGYHWLEAAERALVAGGELENTARMLASQSPEYAELSDAVLRAAPSAKPAAAKAKEPWEMTREQHIAKQDAAEEAWGKRVDFEGKVLVREHPDWSTGRINSEAQRLAGPRPEMVDHYVVTEQALRSGKPVPPEVLADYPNLAKPAAAPEAPVAAPVAPEEAALAPGFTALADQVRSKLRADEAIGDNVAFQKLADQAFGGSRAEGKYLMKDAYDAMEAGVHRYFAEHGSQYLQADPEQAIGTIKAVLASLPTQAIRTAEQEEFQQFSTPPPLAYLVTLIGNVQTGEVVLEPSAGTAAIAAWAKAAGGDVYGNEISPRRRGLYRYVLPDSPVSGADAEFLDSTLDPSVRPTLILMNPPFSATGGRVEKHRNIFGYRHVVEALKRLEDGGRLVAILGRGATPTAPSAQGFWQTVRRNYNLRANVGISGKEYNKYGTSFDNRLVVIDKTGPTTVEPITGDFETVEAAHDALRPIAEDRVSPQVGPPAGDIRGTTRPGVRAPGGRGGVARPGPGVEGVLRPGEVGPGAYAPGVPAHEAGPRPGPPGAREPTGVGARPAADLGELRPAPTVGAQPKARIGVPAAAPSLPAPKEAPPAAVPTPAAPEAKPEVAALEARKKEDLLAREEDDAAYVEYVPAVTGRPHPGRLVESKVMASIQPPAVTYQPALPREALEKAPRPLSAAQIEAVARAGQMHQVTDDAGRRTGFLLGDGTGAGKGQVLAGIIWDNWQQGRRRAIWASASKDLINDAKRDFIGAGADDIAGKLFGVNEYAPAATIDKAEGVAFVTYSTLISKAAGERGRTRLEQIEEWLGPDGVIVLDEAHRAKNAMGGGGRYSAPTQSGEVVLRIQEDLPGARVVYASATSATEVHNLAYLTRLGLWGPGTPFHQGFGHFMAEVGRGGVAALELISRELKAEGKQLSRSISYKGVTYDEVIHALTPEQRDTYQTAARAWQKVLGMCKQQLKDNNATGTKAAANLGQRYWGYHQRFFRKLLTAMKVPTALDLIDRALAEEKSVILSLIGTGEAQQNEAMARAAEGDVDDDLDFSPKEILIGLVKDYYPTTMYEEYEDLDARGQTVIRKRPVQRNGKIVENAEAVRKRDALIKEIEDALKLPDNPLDFVIRYHGRDAVAELTGRRKTVERNPKTGKWEAVSRAPEGVALDAINQHEMEQFQSGKKRIAIISRAAGTGISLHPDLTVKNQQVRRHIVMELSWSADDQMQSFGRSHRTNQKQPPEYVILSTDIGGEKRFSSTIARRLESLGALTKGQRDATGGGILAKYNFETDQGRQATEGFYRHLLTAREVPGTSLHGLDVLEQMGVLKQPQDEEGNPTGPPSVGKEDLREVTRLLNRILNLEPATQNGVYELFTGMFDDVVRIAIESGTLDTGVNLVRGDQIKLVGEKEIATDPATGAKTYHYELEVHRTNRPVSVEFVRDLGHRGRGHMYQHREKALGWPGALIWAEESRTPITNPDGSVETAFNYFIPEHREGHVYQRIGQRELEGSYIRLTQPEYRRLDQARGTVKTRQEYIKGIKERRAKEPEVGKRGEWDELAYYQDRLREAQVEYDAAKEAHEKAKEGQWDLWQQAYQDAAASRVEHIHMIGGSVLRIWQYLNVGGRRMDIRIAYPEGGGSITGVVMSEQDANRVERRLTGERVERSGNSIFEGIIQRNETVQLTGWTRLFRGRINRQPVIQISTRDYNAQNFMEEIGVRKEKIGWQWYHYLPNDAKEAVPLLEKLIKQYPVMEEEEEAAEPSQPHPAARGARPVLPARAVSAGAVQEPISRMAILNQISERFGGLPIRVGRFRERALGIFKVKPEVVRTRVAHDIPVAFHEIGHYVNKLLWGTTPQGNVNWRPLRPFRKELLPIATKAPEEAKLSEGFAEFVRMYVTNPPEAQTRAPNFHRWFEQQLTDQPDLRETLLAARAQVAQYINQPALAKAEAMIRWDPETKPWSSWEGFYTAMVDAGRPIQTAVRWLADKSGTEVPSENAYDLFRVLPGVAEKANHFLEFGTFDPVTLQKTGPPLKEILQPVSDRLRQFQTYLALKHAQELEARGIRSGFEEIDEALGELGDVSAFEPAAQRLYVWLKAVRDYLVRLRFMSRAQANAMDAKYLAYVPFHRVFAPAERGKPPATGTRGKMADLGVPASLMRIKGSQREIEPPLESAVKNLFTFVSLAERNRVGQALVEQAARTEGAGWLVEEVPPPVKPTTFQLEEIRKTLKEAGADLEEADLETVATVFRPAWRAPKGQNILAVRFDGKLRFFQVEPELYRAMLAMDQEGANLVVRVFAIPARLLRLGATGLSLRFTVRNPIRDAATAYMQSEHGFIPGLDSIRGLFHVLGKTELYQEWLRSGAPHSAMVSVDRTHLERTVKELLQHPLKYAARHPVETGRALSELSEAMTRVGEYGLARKAGAEPLQAAVASQEVSLPFQRIGASARAVNMIVAFWNANVQGADKFARSHAGHPGRTLLRAALGLTLPTLLLYLLNRKDERYKEQPRWLKDLFWLVPLPTESARKVTPFIPIPKPFLWGLVYATVPERVMEWLDSRDPKAFDELAERLLETASPGFLPTGMVMPIEWTTGYNLFTGRQIEPEYLKQFPAPYRAQPWTSEFSRFMAHGLDRVGIEVSPVKLDNAIRGSTGGLGQDILTVLNLAAGRERPRQAVDIPGIGALAVRWPTTQAQSVQDLYRRLEELRGKSRAYRAGARYPAGPTAGAPVPAAGELAELARLEAAARTIGGLGRAIREAQGSKLPAKEKQQQVDAYTQRIIELARLAMTQRKLSVRLGHPAAMAAAAR